MKRVSEVRDNLERVYGRGMVGMMNPKTGKLDFERMGWDNHVTGGARMGSQLNVNIGGMIFDASAAASGFLGFAKGMQYSEMARLNNGVIDDGSQLSNCFASSYALINTIEVAAYNWKNLFPSSGSFRGFDALISDPVAIFADSMINFE